MFEYAAQQSTKSHLNQTKNFVQIISDVLLYNGNQHSKLLKYKLKRNMKTQNMAGIKQYLQHYIFTSTNSNLQISGFHMLAVKLLCT